MTAPTPATQTTLADWLLIEAGCAECGSYPLMLPRGTYATLDEAKAASGASGWKAHPNGGEFAQEGDGAFWAAPVAAMSAQGGEFGSEYDPEWR